MKKVCLLALFLSLTFPAQTWAQSPSVSEVTLYSPIKYGPDFGKGLFNFQIGSITPACCRWDLAYGTLSVGEEHDWLQVAASNTTRTAIKDLGALNWNDSFQVPVVEPFPQLKAGEQRLIVVNADGPNRPARPTFPKPLPGPEVNSEALLRGSPIRFGYSPFIIPDVPGPVVGIEGPSLPRKPTPPQPPPAPSRPPSPPTTPIFAKAVVGHIYVVHVVEEDADYYALFRVESLERGDHCTISWKLIPPPENKDPNRAK
ncbi:MAG: hypothetical protein ACJ754_02655 [Pyrinomonadaceae bacterium]